MRHLTRRVKKLSQKRARAVVIFCGGVVWDVVKGQPFTGDLAAAVCLARLASGMPWEAL